MNESGTGTAWTPVEERLRSALAARAHSVGPADLRPLRPPTAARSRRVLLRRAVVGALVLAAVAALVFFTVRDGTSRPAEPARVPRPTIGTPSPVPSTVTPSTAEPSPSAPHP
ncbi:MULTISPECIES: hypothetical protein [Streptomyces]|uniref:hypothetical protein n=1 Tax=Streptomyces TaxID=1883 RepID=UPI0004CD1CCC|nr:hypothetical protein [Streptomyces durhamensis]